jgi:intracellular multiplication protein IcmJ
LRLFPLDRRIIREADLEFNQFPQILAYWRSKDGPFGKLQPKQWVDIYARLGLKSAA